ncbi:alpha/beta hydrolase fold domain-containing protein [Streptomyces sp. NPDC102360]|uniref:alpha/beta hydrolase fold domain-containing protein n=1 Tax=Streptomyces sp. NPDC102360 TaxID=3366160 RepID=UPI0037FD70F6
MPRPTHEVRAREGLEYADGLRLDLHVPVTPDAARIPVVLYLHGGGWLTGSRTDHTERLTRLASYGIAVASADYRLAHVAPYPAQLDDARAAIRWLRREATAHGLAADRIGVWGASAGAHLAALLALSEAQPADSVQALVGCFGAYDLTSRADSVRPDPDLPIPAEVAATSWPAHLPQPPSTRLRQALLAGVTEADLAEHHLRVLSPVTHAHPAAPPALFLHGTADAITSPQQSRWMAEALRAEGAEAHVRLVAGANHEDPAFDSHRVIADIADFFKAHLTASPRLPRLAEPELTTAQRALFEDITSGPRSNGPQHFPLQDAKGALNGPFSLMLHTPGIGAPLQDLGAALRYRTTLDARAREIAILTVAAETASAFETYAHERIDRAAGLSDTELAALRDGSFTSTVLREQTAHDVCRRLLASAGPTWSDEEYARAADVLGPEQLLELTTLVGYYRTLAQLMHVFAVGTPE